MNYQQFEQEQTWNDEQAEREANLKNYFVENGELFFVTSWEEDNEGIASPADWISVFDVQTLHWFIEETGEKLFSYL